MIVNFLRVSQLHFPWIRISSSMPLMEIFWMILLLIAGWLGICLTLTLSYPDITFTVNKLSQFVCKPRTSHLEAAHHLLRYLKHVPSQGLIFPSALNLTVTKYADVDWGNYVDTRKSTSGNCVFLGDALISWKSKKQTTVARSLAKAKYRALANVTSEILRLMQLLKDISVDIGVVKLLCDNQAALHIASNLAFH